MTTEPLTQLLETPRSPDRLERMREVAMAILAAIRDERAANTVLCDAPIDINDFAAAVLSAATGFIAEHVDPMADHDQVAGEIADDFEDILRAQILERWKEGAS